MSLFHGLSSFSHSGLAFIVVLTVVVFAHELGHFLVARWCGVKVLSFSIGFGRELAGFTDKTGTRWKFCLIPLGGYVRMLGDADAAGARSSLAGIADPDRARAFPNQTVWARMAIVAAGPLFNMIFAILVFAGIFMTVGQPLTAPVVGRVLPGSAAEAAGIATGDRFVTIDGTAIRRFEQVRQMTLLALDRPLSVVVERRGERLSLEVRPRVVERTNRFGERTRIPLMGVVASGETVLVRHSLPSSLWAGTEATAGIVSDTFVSIRQMILGLRGADELGGPIRIAEASAEAVQAGVVSLLAMMAFLSINLGLINILPIPLLDGGHLLFYACEALRGKPLPERVREVGLKIGVALVGALVVFSTWNDIVHVFRRWMS